MPCHSPTSSRVDVVGQRVPLKDLPAVHPRLPAPDVRLRAREISASCAAAVDGGVRDLIVIHEHPGSAAVATVDAGSKRIGRRSVPALDRSSRLAGPFGPSTLVVLDGISRNSARLAAPASRAGSLLSSTRSSSRAAPTLRRHGRGPVLVIWPRFGRFRGGTSPLTARYVEVRIPRGHRVRRLAAGRRRAEHDPTERGRRHPDHMDLARAPWRDQIRGRHTESPATPRGRGLWTSS